ncbi:matrixin family metalloprotease [Kineococcus rhizosphaerae]|uniref:matrixin family metalloprotease n=1 Tax=Kineococcus rhizosphaerae TaxID=559628 RepID=UPI000D0780C3|nr:matrixin family metalloprotease [Kineococcus rhizosphaerae]
MPPRDQLPDVPRSPTGRVPQWVLDEATGRPVGDTRWRGQPLSVPAPRRRGHRRRLVVGGALLGAAVLVAVGAGLPGDLTSTAGAGPGTGRALPVAPDQAPAPLGTPEPVAVTSDRWEPLESVGDQPVRWDPCRPVHFVVNPAGMPAGGRAVLDAAIARVSRASGLRFVDDGETDDTERTSPVEDGWFRSRWAPVLVRWDLPAERSEEPEGERRVLGEAGPLRISTGAGRVAYVSGQVGLTVDAASLDPADPPQAALMRAVWLHEFAHLVGLGHVEDPTQLMNPSIQGLTDYAPGDLTGLAALGTGPCLPD